MKILRIFFKAFFWWRRLFFIKRIAIWFFEFEDIKDTISQAREKQKQKTEEYWINYHRYEVEKLERKHALSMSDKQAEIEMLKKEIDDFEKYKKEVDDREYAAKVQIKENFEMATHLMMEANKMVNLSATISGTVKGLYDRVSKHRNNVEELGKKKVKMIERAE